MQSGKKTPADLGGKAIALETKLSEMMDVRQLERPAAAGETEVKLDARVGELTLEHLLGMASNLDWRERYEGDLAKSSIVRMLWLDGAKDMSGLAASVKFGEGGPGKKFIYSSGNAVIAMRAMQNVYGAEYDNMPWSVLFDQIGVEKGNVAFERDVKGVYVGSSYVHTTLNDMAKFGYTYLNGGSPARLVRRFH